MIHQTKSIGSNISDNHSVLFLQDFLKIYSPTGSEASVVDFLICWAKSNGFHAHKDDVGNFVAEIGGTGETRAQLDNANSIYRKEILLVGHVDTVAGEIGVRTHKDILCGRGSVDAKGPLACMLQAAKNAGIKDAKIVVVGCVDEEGESRGARHIVGKYNPDYIIVGEPSGWNNLNIGYKGRLNIFYRNQNNKTHFSHTLGSCYTEAIDFFIKLRDFSDDFNANKSLFQQLGIRIMRFNTHEDGFNETVEVDINIRIPFGIGIHDLRNKIESFKGKACIDYSSVELPVQVSKTNNLMASFIRSIRMFGGSPMFKLKAGTCDMNILQDYNVPMVTYGPGNSEFDHAPNEHISINEYKKSIAILTSVLEELVM